MLNRKFTLIILGKIILVAIFLRLYRLDSLELFGDELDVGYQAYSILKTGRDYRGNFLPLYIESLSESRAPLFLYAAIPFIGIFGLNEWGVRLTAVFWGVLDIVFLYLVVKNVFKKEGLALLTAFLLSVSYWHIHYSRAGFEATLLLFLILAGTYFFLKGEEKPFYYLFSALFFGLSFYTYNTANIFVPLWGVFLLTTNRRKIKEPKLFVLSMLVLVIVFFPLGLKILSGQASARFKMISIFSDRETIDWIINKRSSGGNTISERIFNNKLTRVSFKFMENYLTALSPQFWFISGDPNPRHSIPGFGLLPLAFLTPLVLGMYVTLRQLPQKFEYQFWWFWLIISPLASALTKDGGNQATRLFLMLPPLIVFCAQGADFLLSRKYRKLFMGLLSLWLIFNLLSYEYELFSHYPKDQYRYWHYGYKEITLALKNSNCQKIYINNNHEPFLIRYLFWLKIDPLWFQKNFQGDQKREKINQFFEGFRLGNSFFGRFVGPDKIFTAKQLLQERGSCLIAFQEDEIPGNWNLEKDPCEGVKVLKLVKTPLGDPYIYLLTGDLE